MTYSIDQHLTKVNKGKKGDNTPEWIVCHFVGASGQAWGNAKYFHSTYRGASAQYFVDPKHIVQVVEDDTPAWHIGDGSRTGKGSHNGYVVEGGATNTNSIGIEMCQDTSTGKNAWYWEFHPETVERAEWLIRGLQKKYNIDDDHVIRHFDASGKICPGNWQYDNWAKWEEFKDRLEKDIAQPTPSAKPKDEGKFKDDHMHIVEHGDTLYSIAKEYKVKVADLVKWNDLEDKNLIFPESKLFVKDPEVSNYPAASDVESMAKDVIAGKYGSGEVRKKKLGDQFEAVQMMVNAILLGKPRPTPSQPKQHATPLKPKKSIDQLAREVIDGKHGSGSERKKSLGSSYETVQKRVNDMLIDTKKPAKSIDELAEEVIAGLHGSGRERMVSLGSNYVKVQQEVNRRFRKR